jgi:phenylacetate-CoA ligase
MRRIEKISGRSDDMLIVRGVNVFPSQIEELILRDPALAPHYKIVVERAGNLDAMTVSVEPASGATNEEVAAAKLRDRIKTFVGISVTIEMLPRGSIEPSAGKARRVFDRRTATGQVLSPSTPR